MYYVKILKEMQSTKKPVIVIDDAQYLMANEFMRRATERGYDKFTEIAQNFWNLVNKVKELPDNQIVYFLAHIERDQNGNEKIKTIGKLLDEKITVEGMFTIVLKTNVTDGAYTFLTQNSGHDTVKSPIGMFKTFAIDNDLKYVDDKIRNYYEIGNFKSDAEMEKADNAVAAKTPETEEKKPKRGRRQAAVIEQEIKEQESEAPVEEELQETVEPTNNDPASEANQGPEEAAETPRSRRRGRRAVAETAIANAVSEDAKEEVPFDETPQPVIPQRKKREETEDAAPMTDNIISDEPTESAPVRRRVRRRQ